MTPEELTAIYQRENGRVGREVIDQGGRSYWITDVVEDDRLRVVGEDGKSYWFDPNTRVATCIRPKKTTGARA